MIPFEYMMTAIKADREVVETFEGLTGCEEYEVLKMKKEEQCSHLEK